MTIRLSGPSWRTFLTGAKPKRTRIPRAKSPGEEALVLQLMASQLPMPEREQELIEGRKFACDFVWRSRRLVVEVEGGTRKGGRHTYHPGFERDCEKYNILALDGWRVLRFTTEQVTTGKALDTIVQAIEK